MQIFSIVVKLHNTMQTNVAFSFLENPSKNVNLLKIYLLLNPSKIFEFLSNGLKNTLTDHFLLLLFY